MVQRKEHLACSLVLLVEMLFHFISKRFISHQILYILSQFCKILSKSFIIPGPPMEHKVIWGIKQLNSNYNYQILWFTFSSNVKQEVSLLDKKAFTYPLHHHAPQQLVGWREQGHTDPAGGSGRRSGRQQSSLSEAKQAASLWRDLNSSSETTF